MKPFIGSIIGAVFFIWLFNSCSHLTVAPKPVYAGVIAFDKSTQNAGIIDCDKSGCLVTAGWLDRYHRMEKEFNSTVFEDTYITEEGKNFRVPFACQNHYAEMRASERGP